MYFPYFHSFITFFILAISRSNFAQIQWSWTFFNSQYNELFKNVGVFKIWEEFDRVILEKLWEVFLCSPFSLKIALRCSKLPNQNLWHILLLVVLVLIYLQTKNMYKAYFFSNQNQLNPLCHDLLALKTCCFIIWLFI